MTTKLLIDADVIAYRAGFAAEKTKYLVTMDGVSENPQFFHDDAKAAKEDAFSKDGVVWSRKDVQPVEQALLIADVMISDIKDRYGSENPSVVTYLSGVGNFRHSIATRATYKGNRSGSVPPIHLKAIRNHLINRGAIISRGEEADDLLGIAATANPGSIVCSIDKDLLQLPGRHYNFVTKEEVTISPKEAALNFYSQVLSGDATDNVPGLPGIGAVKARKLLADCKTPLDCWFRIVDVYQQEFDTNGQKYAIETARLVYLRRKPNELWNPPGLNADGKPTEETKAVIKKKASGIECSSTKFGGAPNGAKGRVPVSV